MSLYAGLRAVCRRQLGSLLANPLGYVFILVFVFVVNQLCFVQDEFYKRNVADLGMLEQVMPWLLAVLLSAIGMNAWTLEREQGTEELLLTLPLTMSDAVIGKYVSILGFFSVALLCSMSSVCVLWYLGSPDIGLLLANYCGWWLMGAAFAGLALFASVSVHSQAISFVLSLILCSSAIGIGSLLDWGQSFARGLFSFADLSLAIAYIIIGLSLALILLAARRWRPQTKRMRVWQIIALLAAIVCAVNVSRMGKRWNWNLDMSSEGLSSLSGASKHIAREIKSPMELTVVISESLPDELRVRGRELLDMCRALKQSMGSQLDLKIIYADDPLTNQGRYVQDHLKVEAHQMQTDTVAGRQTVSVFLGAYLQSAQLSQSLPFFADGMSIEFELVRALRNLDQRLRHTQKVIGVVSTEIELLEHFSRLSGEMKPAWQLVEELRKQYDVREVNPDLPIDPAIDALLVPLPSGLTQTQLLHLHDYIWNGGPALLLSDPMPILVMEESQRYGVAIAPSLPRYDRFAKNQNSRGPRNAKQAAAEKKGAIQDIYHALGITLDTNAITWAQFKPDASLPQLPPEFVWLRDDVGSFADNKILNGLQTMMCIYPGSIQIDPTSMMHTEALIKIGMSVPWGTNPFTDYLAGSGANMKFQTQVLRSQEHGTPPALAVEIRGKMPRAFAAVAESSADSSADVGSAENAAATAGNNTGKKAKPHAGIDLDLSVLSAPENQPAPAPAMQLPQVGQKSSHDTHVIVVADLDLAHDRFFSMAKSMDQKNSSDFQKIWASIRNVQFLLNAVDSLAGDDALLALRSRHARYRSLERLDELRQKTRDKKLAVKDALEKKVSKEIAAIQADFDQQIKAIDDNKDLDQHSRLNKTALLKKEREAYLQRYTDTQNKVLAVAIRDAEIEERRTLNLYQQRVGLLAIGVPVGILFIVISIVVYLRRKREQRDIPANRRRGQRDEKERVA